MAPIELMKRCFRDARARARVQEQLLYCLTHSPGASPRTPALRERLRRAQQRIWPNSRFLRKDV
jgi:hypothetical protein